MEKYILNITNYREMCGYPRQLLLLSLYFIDFIFDLSSDIHMYLGGLSFFPPITRTSNSVQYMLSKFLIFSKIIERGSQ